MINLETMHRTNEPTCVSSVWANLIAGSLQSLRCGAPKRPFTHVDPHGLGIGHEVGNFVLGLWRTANKFKFRA